MPGSDHHVTRLQFACHFHLAWAAHPYLDLDPLGRPGLRITRRGLQQHDKLALALRHQRLLRDDMGILALTEHRIDPGEHAGPQLELAVVDASPHRHRAAIGIQQGVNGLDHGHELAPWQRIHIHTGLLPALHLGLVALGQAEIHIQGVDVFQVDDVGTVFQVVPHIGGADTRDTVKRRHDLQPCSACLRQCQLGLGNLQVGSTLIHRPLADKALRHQFLVAFVVGLGNGQLGLALLHLGRLQLVVQLHQQLAFADTRTVVEIQLGDAPPHFGADHHALARTQAANRLGFIGDGGQPHLGGLNRRGSACSGRCRSTLRCRGGYKLGVALPGTLAGTLVLKPPGRP